MALIWTMKICLWPCGPSLWIWRENCSPLNSLPALNSAGRETGFLCSPYTSPVRALSPPHCDGVFWKLWGKAMQKLSCPRLRFKFGQHWWQRCVEFSSLTCCSEQDNPNSKSALRLCWATSYKTPRMETSYLSHNLNKAVPSSWGWSFSWCASLASWDWACGYCRSYLTYHWGKLGSSVFVIHSQIIVGCYYITSSPCEFRSAPSASPCRTAPDHSSPPLLPLSINVLLFCIISTSPDFILCMYLLRMLTISNVE